MTQAYAEVLDGSRWLMEPKAMRALLTRALATSAQEVEAARVAFAGMPERMMQPTMVGDVAVIAMTGPIVYRMSWFAMLFGCASIEMMCQQFRTALADPAVRTILFRCDSPGGTVDMVPEFADEIYAARGTKPLVAAADTWMASAAYWLGAQCDQIHATRSSMLGSIGTYVQHEDISGMLEQLGIKITLIAHPAKKVDGNEYSPLSETAQADYQAYVDEVGLEFEAAVARGRGVPKSTVTEWTQLGIPPRGKRAIALGLADKMGTFDAVLAKLTKGRGGMRAAASAPAVAAVAATKAKDDPIEPDEDGNCPEGYEKHDDGMCHLMDMEAKAAVARQAQAARDRDLTETAVALTRG